MADSPRPWLPQRWREYPYRFLAVLLLALLLLDCRWDGLGRYADWAGNDALLHWQARGRSPSDDIVIIDVDQRSIEHMNKDFDTWPWPRSVHGELIEALSKQHARAVAFDFLFNEPDARSDSEVYFRDVVAHHANVYVAAKQMLDGRPQNLLPYASLLHLQHDPGTAAPKAVILLPTVLPASSWRTGLINALPDDDHMLRRYAVWPSIGGGWRFPSLPARLAADQGLSVPQAEAITLHWRNAHPYRHVSYSDIYEDQARQHPLRPADEFRDKLVLVGVGGISFDDVHATPIGNEVAGVDVLATAVDNLEHQDWLQPWRPVSSLLLFLPLMLYLVRRYEARANILTTALALLGMSLAAAVLAYLALFWNAQLPVFTALAWVWVAFWLFALFAWRREKAEQERVVSMWSQTMDARVVRNLQKGGQLSGEPELREITVLFSDIRGFTTLSETRTPQQVVDMLNRYFTAQVEVLFRHEGCLDKFIGDAIMGFWGAPNEQPDHAQRAVAAALDMAAAVEVFKAEMAAEGLVFDIGIGLHSGAAVVGMIGTPQRSNYTTIGDTVNLASRIEGQTKGIARVLVSESTRQACGDAFDFIDHGEFTVKGREQAVRLFEPKRRSAYNPQPI